MGGYRGSIRGLGDYDGPKTRIISDCTSVQHVYSRTELPPPFRPAAGSVLQCALGLASLPFVRSFWLS